MNDGHGGEMGDENRSEKNAINHVRICLCIYTRMVLSLLKTKNFHFHSFHSQTVYVACSLTYGTQKTKTTCKKK